MFYPPIAFRRLSNHLSNVSSYQAIFTTRRICSSLHVESVKDIQVDRKVT